MLMLGYMSYAAANDKDILREACSSLKVAAKRSECHSALDRIASSPTVKTLSEPIALKKEDPGPLKVNVRGLSCESFEYGELDSMTRDELEGLYCSFRLGEDISKRVTDKSMAEHSDNPNIQAAVLSRHIQLSERCMRSMGKSDDLFRRKFPGEKIDCSRMPKPKQQAAQGPQAQPDGAQLTVKQ